MLSWPLQTSFHFSRSPSRLDSSLPHSELMVVGAGENVPTRSLVCTAVKHFEDSRDGLIAPFASIRLMIFHSPGCMPSASAFDAQSAMTAVITTRPANDIETSPNQLPPRPHIRIQHPHP